MAARNRLVALEFNLIVLLEHHDCWRSESCLAPWYCSCLQLCWVLELLFHLWFVWTVS